MILVDKRTEVHADLKTQDMSCLVAYVLIVQLRGRKLSLFSRLSRSALTQKPVSRNFFHD
jgi:hypothetical protein